MCQDPIEKFFGCQRQVRGTNDNPSAKEFLQNTQVLRVVNAFCRNTPGTGNCRGDNHSDKIIEQEDYSPLPKRKKSKK